MTFGLVKHNNNSISAITSAGQLAQGKMTLLQTQTASSSASISFTSNIDSTYPIYLFKFINIHPATDGAEFTINFSTDSGSNYNVAKTTTFFVAYNAESESSSGLTYIDSLDIAQGTGVANIFYNVGNENDESASGTLHLFDPSSTTFVKHFKSRISNAENQSAIDTFVAGYGNTTSAVDAVQFKFLSGNIDSGTIKLYGVS